MMAEKNAKVTESAPNPAAAAVTQKKIDSQADTDHPNHIGILLWVFWMTPDLTDDDKAIIVELLREAIERLRAPPASAWLRDRGKMQRTTAGLRLDHGKVAVAVLCQGERRAMLAVSGSSRIEFRCEGHLV
jgi:hypothetical protein